MSLSSRAVPVVCLLCLIAAPAWASDLVGAVTDETGAALPGVAVEVRTSGRGVLTTVTDERGQYAVPDIGAGPVQVSFVMPQFAAARHEVLVPATGSVRLDETLHLALSADVIVSGRRTFTNLADVDNPAENLVGVAQSASQGAITARQLENRPIMRSGEVLETVPGVIISQHSGEGKANQYYLRGFNLDHGTDFSTMVAGIPVNMPTHGHGHGYTDLGFLIPELVSGVQYAKGPYFAEQGDFATAGSANITYVNLLDRPIVDVTGGQDGFARALVAVAPAVGDGHLLAAVEVGHNDGPWTRPDDLRKYNGLVRFSRGDALSGLVLTAMGYQASWDSTDQVPARAVDAGLIDRFGHLDSTDGGDTYRYSGSVEWQRTAGSATTRGSAYGLAYGVDLFSNFTYFLDDQTRGDQFEQGDRRVVAGGRLSQLSMHRWADRLVRTTVGVQVRHDRISRVGLYHTQARVRLETTREDAVQQSSAALHAQNEIEWGPRLRSLVGVRFDGYRFDVDAGDPRNSGVQYESIVSPKGGLVIGPFAGTEFYANAGWGFHSNDARGATITVDPSTGEPVDRVTPLVRAAGAEVGVRTVAVPHLQSSLALWSLTLDSELVFIGDAGTTEAGRPSHRYGVEFANYVSPLPWLTLDGDVSWSSAHFTDDDPSGDVIPGSVQTVVSGGVAVDAVGGLFGSLRLRYFGPRTLVADDSARSAKTSLVNLEAGYRLTPRARVVLDVFNLLNAADSDVDYYYESRLPGEPDEGVADTHRHPTIPRTMRLTLQVTF